MVIVINVLMLCHEVITLSRNPLIKGLQKGRQFRSFVFCKIIKSIKTNWKFHNCKFFEKLSKNISKMFLALKGMFLPYNDCFQPYNVHHSALKCLFFSLQMYIFSQKSTFLCSFVFCKIQNNTTHYNYFENFAKK